MQFGLSCLWCYYYLQYMGSDDKMTMLLNKNLSGSDLCAIATIAACEGWLEHLAFVLKS